MIEFVFLQHKLFFHKYCLQILKKNDLKGLDFLLILNLKKKKKNTLITTSFEVLKPLNKDMNSGGIDVDLFFIGSEDDN